jgi:BirA family biotin operon repressor/biotin-[acetyl-CoA-carboxylase] ligase
MTDATWSDAADPSRRIGRAVEFHDEIGSTNDRARAALRDPGGDGLAVVADVQTAGRGRRGRTWESPPGLNLTVSVAVRPGVEARMAGLLGMAAALAVRDACAAVAPDAGLLVKWPNDVVSADGRKLAGLLVETAVEDGRLAEAVIGMGINVNWPVADMPADVRSRATSMLELTGRQVDRVALLGAVLAALDAEMAALERGESPMRRLASVSALGGRRVTVDLGGEHVDGRVAGVSEEGFLQLDTEVGRLALAVGEVVAVRESDAVGADA